MVKKLGIIGFIILAFSQVACESDSQVAECDGTAATYDAQIKTIIENNCTSSRCHGSGSNNGDYTSFSGLSSDLSNGNFEREVLTSQSMPKNGSLSQEEINMIKCWVNNGYAEN